MPILKVRPGLAVIMDGGVASAMHMYPSPNPMAQDSHCDGTHLAIDSKVYADIK